MSPRPKNADVVLSMADDLFSCHDCWLNDGARMKYFDPQALLDHLKEHVAAGHRVQQYTTNKLTKMTKEPKWKSRINWRKMKPNSTKG